MLDVNHDGEKIKDKNIHDYILKIDQMELFCLISNDWSIGTILRIEGWNDSIVLKHHCRFSCRWQCAVEYDRSTLSSNKRRFLFLTYFIILAVTEPSILGSEVAVMTIGQVNFDQ